LFSAPAKITTAVFGLRESTLRFPSLVGALAYLILCYFLVRRLVGDTVLLPLSLALLAWNPLILDFMPAARGYILGLACILAALLFMDRTLALPLFDPGDTLWRWDCAWASAFLALSVVANLSNIFPATALAVAFLAAVLFRCPAHARARDFRFLLGLLVAPG